MFPLVDHNCGDSLLKCIDCNAQICPKCLVQCPVGNRCKNCSKRFTSHVLQIDFWVVLRSFMAALVAGLLFAFLQALFPLGGLAMLLFIYLFGSLAGNIIFKIAGRKLGAKIVTTVIAGLLSGSLCIAPISLSLIVFILGAIGPFLGWGNFFSGLFRR